MTFREKIMQEHPESMNERCVEGIEGCPYAYGYETEVESKRNCRSNGGKGCKYCFDREIPVTERKTFSKYDLKDGMVVVYRCGIERIVCNGTLYEMSKGLPLTSYNENMKVQNHGALDIMEVYEKNNLIWERKEPKKMTKEEIEKALGYEIEYVGE